MMIWCIKFQQTDFLWSVVWLITMYPALTTMVMDVKGFSKVVSPASCWFEEQWSIWGFRLSPRLTGRFRHDVSRRCGLWAKTEDTTSTQLAWSCWRKKNLALVNRHCLPLSSFSDKVLISSWGGPAPYKANMTELVRGFRQRWGHGAQVKDSS